MIFKKKINKWIKDWENKDREFFTFYDPLSFSKTARIPFKKNSWIKNFFYFKKNINGLIFLFLISKYYKDHTML